MAKPGGNGMHRPWNIHPRGRAHCLTCILPECVEAYANTDPRRQACPVYAGALAADRRRLQEKLRVREEAQNAAP